MKHLNATVVLVLGLLAGCSSTSIYVPLTRPMEIDLRGMQRIGVALYRSASDTQWEAMVTANDLTDSFIRPIGEDGRFGPFDLYDYAKQLPRKIDTSIVTKNTVKAFTKITGAEAYIFGEVLQLAYNEDIISADVRRFDKPSGKQIVRKGLLRMSVHLRIVDAASQTMIWDQIVYDEVPYETSAADSEPEAIDPRPLALDAAADISRKMLELTRQINESVLVTFLHVSGYPEIEKAIKLAQKGDWPQTIEIFDQLVERSKGTPDEHKLLYDAGIAYQYSYNFRKAKEYFERAYKLKDSQRYKIAIEDCLKMERSYLELVKQK